MKHGNTMVRTESERWTGQQNKRYKNWQNDVGTWRVDGRKRQNGIHGCEYKMQSDA